MPPDTPSLPQVRPGDVTRPAWWTVFSLCVLVAVALGVRLPALDRQGYSLDEVWSLEISAGRGSAHEHLPVNRVVAALPQFCSLDAAAPWWQVWSHVEVTHPPLYPILLRWWEDAFGGGAAAGRLFSVIASVGAVAVLFDVVRLQAGTGAALWAGLLMAVAAPQVEHARLARGYALLTLVALAAADALVRIRVLGFTRRRWSGLTAALLATLLTHYFCLGAVLAMAAWSAVVRQVPRRPVLAAFAAAAVAFAATWFPFMWAQRHLFATDDPNTLFLAGGPADHLWRTTIRLVLEGPTLLGLPLSGELAPLGVAVTLALFVVPLLPAIRRRSPCVSFWWVWTSGTVAVVAALDFTRGTNHLLFNRYTLLAGPGVYALVPCVAGVIGRRRWAKTVLAIGSVGGCLLGLSAAYTVPLDDPRLVVRSLPIPPGPHDLLLFATGSADVVRAESEVLQLERYLPPARTPFAILTRPGGADTVAAARRSRLVYLFTSAGDYHTYLPEGRVIGFAAYRGLGNVWTLEFAH